MEFDIQKLQTTNNSILLELVETESKGSKFELAEKSEVILGTVLTPPRIHRDPVEGTDYKQGDTVVVSPTAQSRFNYSQGGKNYQVYYIEDIIGVLKD